VLLVVIMFSFGCFAPVKRSSPMIYFECFSHVNITQIASFNSSLYTSRPIHLHTAFQSVLDYFLVLCLHACCIIVTR